MDDKVTTKPTGRADAVAADSFRRLARTDGASDGFERAGRSLLLADASDCSTAVLVNLRTRQTWPSGVIDAAY